MTAKLLSATNTSRRFGTQRRTWAMICQAQVVRVLCARARLA